MSERVVDFFELVADASIFNSAFSNAKRQAIEFAAGFKSSASSVVSDANRMQAAMARVALAQKNMAGFSTHLAGGTGGVVGGAETVAGDASGMRGPRGGLVMSGGASGGLMGIYAALGIVGALSGVAAVLASAVAGYADFSAQILRNSEAIGMNTADLQTWEKIGGLVGIGADNMALDFQRFGKNLAEGARALKATGFTLKDLGITTTDVGKAILQLSDYFHTHNDQAQKAAIATALFGRSGAELIPILDQGSGAFRNYEAELKKMGVLLSNSQLFAGAQAQVAIQQFSMAFDAAKDRLIAAALPGFTQFFLQVSSLIEANMPLWQELGQIVGQVVTFIAGMLGGLLGHPLDLSGPVTDAGAAYQGLGGAAKDAAGGIGSATNATNNATAALDRLIQKLQDQKRAYDDAAEAQKAALQDQLDTLHDVTDSRRRQGEDLVSYERRLEELGLSDKIKAIDKAKSIYDRQVDNHIAALEKEKAAVKAAGAAMGADLSSGISRGMNAGVAASGKAIGQLNKQWADAGTRFGAWLITFFKNPTAAMTEAADSFGQLLGSAMVQGAEHQLLTQLNDFFTHKDANAGRGRVGSAGHARGTITHGREFAEIGEEGTEVVLPTYDRSRSLALMEASGMASLARSAGGGSQGGGGGMPPIVVNFLGPVADELVAARVLAKINKEMRKRGFTLAQGI